MIKVKRFFLEILSADLVESEIQLTADVEIKQEKRNFEINKFFYKQIGIDHYWRDRLVWSDREWTSYLTNKNLETWTMKSKGHLVGFYELEFHRDTNEVELINMGVLKDYRGKKFGSKLLSHSINISCAKKPSRMWVHTCSVDHKFALTKYKSRGFKIFKEEDINFVA